MSVDWEKIIRQGIKQLESDCNDWIETMWDTGTEKSSHYYYDRANSLYHQKRYAEAIKEYTQAINGNLEDYRAYFYRGAAHCCLKRYQQALKDYDRTLEINPKFVDGYYYRGFLRQKLGDLAGAIADFTEVIGLDPDQPRIFFYRGAVLAAVGDFERAIADFSKLIDFAPTADKYYNRGVIYYQMAAYDLAVQDLSQAVQLEAEFIAAYYGLGNAYYALKDLEKATETYKQAQASDRTIDPQDEHGYYALGIAHLNQENLEQAKLNLRQAAFLCRENHNLVLNLQIVKTLSKLQRSQ